MTVLETQIVTQKVHQFVHGSGRPHYREHVSVITNWEYQWDTRL